LGNSVANFEHLNWLEHLTKRSPRSGLFHLNNASLCKHQQVHEYLARFVSRSTSAKETCKLKTVLIAPLELLVEEVQESEPVSSHVLLNVEVVVHTR